MRKFYLCMLALHSSVALAGSKGLDVLMLNIGDGAFFESRIYKEYSINFNNGNIDDCWSKHGDGVTGISLIAKKKLSIGVDLNTAINVWNDDKAAISNVRLIMHKRDEGHTTNDGYHGMYIIKPEGNKLTLMGLGANEDRKKGLSGVSEKVTVTLDGKDPKKAARQFEQALCKVSKPFNIGFSI